jgi:ATP-dependent Zn protease
LLILEKNKDLLDKTAEKLLKDEVIEGKALTDLANSVKAEPVADESLPSDAGMNAKAA